MLAEGMPKNECFFLGSNITCLRFVSICDLFTDSLSYLTTSVTNCVKTELFRPPRVRRDICDVCLSICE
jgi:hypothetical protein